MIYLNFKNIGNAEDFLKKQFESCLLNSWHQLRKIEKIEACYETIKSYKCNRYRQNIHHNNQFEAILTNHDNHII